MRYNLAYIFRLSFTFAAHASLTFLSVYIANRWKKRHDVIKNSLCSVNDRTTNSTTAIHTTTLKLWLQCFRPCTLRQAVCWRANWRWISGQQSADEGSNAPKHLWSRVMGCCCMPCSNMQSFKCVSCSCSVSFDAKTCLFSRSRHRHSLLRDVYSFRHLIFVLCSL